MAIILDPPIDWHGKFKGCSHMISTLHGAEGTEELKAFAKRIGMRAEWIQYPGTYKEHFDVFGTRRPRAVVAGAKEVTRKEWVEVYRDKRAAERKTPNQQETERA